MVKLCYCVIVRLTEEKPIIPWALSLVRIPTMMELVSPSVAPVGADKETWKASKTSGISSSSSTTVNVLFTSPSAKANTANLKITAI